MRTHENIFEEIQVIRINNKSAYMYYKKEWHWMTDELTCDVYQIFDDVARLVFEHHDRNTAALKFKEIALDMMENYQAELRYIQPVPVEGDQKNQLDLI